MSELRELIILTSVFQNGDWEDKKLTSLKVYDTETGESNYIEFNGDFYKLLKKLKQNDEYFNGDENE